MTSFPAFLHRESIETILSPTFGHFLLHLPPNLFSDLAAEGFIDSFGFARFL
jgi:hypothetical protein